MPRVPPVSRPTGGPWEHDDHVGPCDGAEPVTTTAANRVFGRGSSEVASRMARPDPDAADDDSPRLSRWQQLTGSVSNFMLKPAPAKSESEGSASKDAGPTTIPEIEAAIKRADDKERLIGLLLAPVAAAIALVVVAVLQADDPAVLLSNGQINKLHVNPSLYSELGAVTLALALLMLGAAWYRKRLLLGIAMALYGLSIFNLHYWGFGFPYIVAGAWYLVRAYRLSEKLKFAKADDPGTAGGGPAPKPSPSKRYTPPAAPIRRAPKPKPGKELEAG